ncbi:uncharacterized protein LOC18447815 isoform X2 [Amborella trichopoda]|uniref:uncharacterized protein LOC18447815 isoform X2 n=1 Tax=Amborella trichopoda TaxID=13333 RepID=UPI0009BCC163|nr:uncharacterized protein LOC18447815 isoform X2 [Amborella trichopoda]|eukprot:XP_020531318.1 uncharacterized protein LOC18447815 isoform X2 [Amborella trichopoda]
MEERGAGGKQSKKKSTWPAIKSKHNVQINQLKNLDLFTIPDILTAAESRAFITVAESMGFSHQGSLGPAKGEAYRDNDRISVNDPILAETLWHCGLQNMFTDIKIRGKVAVGLNPSIRFYRYNIGQRFGRHIDESVELGDGRTTKYTLLIYLNGSPRSKVSSNSSSDRNSSARSLVGGETVFYNNRGGIVAEFYLCKPDRYQ